MYQRNAEAASIRVFLIKNSLPPSRKDEEASWKVANVKPIIGMDDPFYYRNKVHAVFDRDKKGNIICGTYEAKTHKVVPIEECMIEDKISQEIIRTIRDMLKSFRIKTYDEDTGYGLLRHVLVRRGFPQMRSWWFW